MKKTLAIAIISIFSFQLSVAQQLYNQQVPDQVAEVRLTGDVRLVVRSTDGPMAIFTAGNTQVASVRHGVMTLAHSDFDIVLLLPAGRPVGFVAEDHSSLTFDGSLGKRPSLKVHTKDYARALFSGSLADSVWATTISLQAEDYSIIHSEVRLIQYGFEVLPKDYAHITVDCFQERAEPGLASRTQRMRTCEHCVVNWNYCDDDTTINMRGDADYAQSVGGKRRDAMHRIDSIRRRIGWLPDSTGTHGADASSNTAAKRSFWQWRDVALNFTWGFHNWGTSMFGGFDGVEGDAAVRTSFNHIHLSVDYPLLATRHAGLYVGFGLEWDKFKFTAPEVSLATGVEPHAFADGGDGSCTSWLNTRYVVVPLTLRFDLWHDWNLSLSALPGLHWGGSHTGLRREYESDLELRQERDQSVNAYINPYKLDLRATLGYGQLGLYLQVPTLSTFRSSVQDLYPIRFGLSLWFD